MKKETIITSIFIILIFLGVITISYWYSPETDYYCLVEKSTSYCIEEGFDGRSYSNTMGFSCYSQKGDERKGFENTTERFYFIEQEIKECLGKEAKSWRKKR